MDPRPLLITLAFSALLTLAACATDTSTGTAATPQDAATLSDLVSRAVHDVPGVSMTDLTVSTYKGVVTLKGRTATRTQAQEAIEAARHVPGVQKVDYDISVDQ